MFKLSNNNELGKELRMAVVDSLKEVMESDDSVVALDADLGAASGWSKIKEEFPDRFINVGISEANMVGLSAGLSLTNHRPFIHTFSPFATRRVFDQLYISGGYSENNINIYGSDPGFTAGPNGGTHTSFKDMALIRMIPGSTICDAADAVQMEWLIKEYAKKDGINYVRGNRKAVRTVYEEGSTFEIGKGNLIREGKDILFIATGQLVSDALIVAKELEEDGYNVEVIDMFTIKPLDINMILERTKDKEKVFTIENHSINNGLGSSVAEVIAENNIPVKLHRIGVNERFGQVGTPDFLQREFGLDSKSIKQNILNHL